MLAHTLPWLYKHLMVIGCQKHLISSLCYTSVTFSFSPTSPSQKALLRSPCQAVTMTTSENAILYDLRTHWNHQTKVPRGGGATNSLNKALFGVGPLTTMGVRIFFSSMSPYICLKVRTGNAFPWAPVSIFSLRNWLLLFCEHCTSMVVKASPCLDTAWGTHLTLSGYEMSL